MTTNVGSYLLRDLKDPALPEAISWLPQTLGWQILALIVFIMIARGIVKTVKRHWQNRYRNEAKAALQNVSKSDPIAAINTYQQITNIVISYLQLLATDNISARQNTVEFMLSSATQPINENLLNEWYQALMQPNIAKQWSTEQLTTLHSEIEMWLATHEFNKGNA